ncbi:soluble lamin-associated protein of 75 kDa isoform X2 [Myxocyprinus asiaticus]|uniref:soluble lamin-associated protein of 75 kDa isoform X2 n=1 Tax=Myxocyprinus asiaticus TaxID=70543 RepID=UPI0022228BCA|nr:soluble lamin-associated protein of 75 kDa isoform X2 [Myxocyprinus asiaticus]
MEFPVDLLVSAKHEDLESSAQIYMNKLLYSNPDNTQYLSLPSSRKIRISPANVGFVPLYGANLRYKVLALFAPEDQFTAVALFLTDQWYTVEDILRTSNPAREGLVKVRSVGERIVLYILNRIIYRTVEMSSNEVPFLCHGEDDYAKILWKNGEAVGFYSVKSKGSLCNSFVSQCYLLPIMDTIFVRKDHRGNGHGLQMLEDFVDSFKDDELGLKYPLTQAMQKVCSQYLITYPADGDLLWEVEGVGGPYQKVKVASKLGSLALRCSHSSWTEEHSKNGKVSNIEESLDIMEEVVVVNKHLKVAEEMNELPISTRTRSSECKQKKRLREEPEESAEKNRPEKINRLEEPETEPDAVVPKTKEPVDGESAGEQDDKVEGEEAAATQTFALKAEHECLVAEVNGELSDSQEEENEASADTAENVLDQECPLEEEIFLQNGTAEEEEMEDDIVDPSEESEEPAAVAEQIDQEPITEEKQEAEVENSPADEEEKEEEVASAIEEEKDEDVAPAVDEKHVEQIETKDTDQPTTVEAYTADLEDGDSEAVGEPVPPEPNAPEEEASAAPAAPAVAEEGEAAMKTEEPAVNQEDETASNVPLEAKESQLTMGDKEIEDEMEAGYEKEVVPEEPDEEKQADADEKGEQIEEENSLATEDEEKGEEEEKSLDEANDSTPDIRVLRGGRSKPVPPTPKRTSSRRSKVVIIEEVVEKEQLTSTEEEKGSTEEEETEEHSTGEEEEPPVIDRRMLRHKTKEIKSTPRVKAKRRSKI